MPRRDLTAEGCEQLLADENLARVAFQDNEAPYLIPLGSVYLAPAMYGVADAGHKTELAKENPTVSFQVDTSRETGLWEWRSVTGKGRFEIVGEEQEKNRALGALQPVISEAPGWWQREQGPRMATGALLVWKITPTEISGCEYVPKRDNE